MAYVARAAASAGNHGKLDPKPEPAPLPAQGKRVEPSWRMARKRRR
jgi:hypothetical protein